jgi:uncharacterized protein YlzI (FlbEa/FlbD family)
MLHILYEYGKGVFYFMIILTKLHGDEVLINEDFIESATENPDTVIVMNNGKSYTVQESVEEIVRQAVAFKRALRRRPREDE